VAARENFFLMLPVYKYAYFVLQLMSLGVAIISGLGNIWSLYTKNITEIKAKNNRFRLFISD